MRDSGHHKTFDLLETMRGFLGENDMMAYLAMMAARLIELHRVLKDTGSLYLHCDPTASHYLKLLLDGVFGFKNYRSEVIWQRTSAHNSAKRWGPIHDVIFFYTKSTEFTWNRTFTDYDPAYVDRYYRHFDESGRRYRMSDLTASGTRNGESGKEWNGFDPTTHGRHWAIPKLAKDCFPKAKDLKTLGWLALLDENDMVEMTGEAPGWPHFRRFLDQMEGQSPQDIIVDIPPLGKRHAERLGYPTQKPLALLERIIAASSNEGDVVLDPFCGCGTAVDAAEKLGRQWLGIDVTHLSINLIEQRMKDAHPKAEFKVVGRPESLAGAEELAKRDKHEFEKWIVPQLDGHLFEGGRKGADGGIDGFIYFKPDGKKTEKAILSVKGGENVGVAMIRDLHSTMEREKATAGVFITKALPTKPMETEASKVGLFESEVTGRKHPRLQIITLAEIFAGKRPDLPWVVSPYKKAQRSQKPDTQGKLL